MWIERQPPELKVMGSSPVSLIRKSLRCKELADYMNPLF